jgi:hypothetical protein
MEVNEFASKLVANLQIQARGISKKIQAGEYDGFESLIRAGELRALSSTIDAVIVAADLKPKKLSDNIIKFPQK